MVVHLSSWMLHVAQGAGYRSAPRGRFDPLNQAASGSPTPLEGKLQASPEEQCLEAEAKVHLALEQSAEALVKGDASGGMHCAFVRHQLQHFQISGFTLPLHAA